MEKIKIGFIGAGNMGAAIMKGISAQILKSLKLLQNTALKPAQTLLRLQKNADMFSLL